MDEPVDFDQLRASVQRAVVAAREQGRRRPTLAELAGELGVDGELVLVALGTAATPRQS